MRSGRLVLAAIFLLVGTVPGITAQTVHEIEIIGDRERDRFRFSPARVVVEPGDIVRFRVQSGAPHSVVFDSTGLSSRDRSALDAAITDRMSLLSGPLLTADDQVFEIRVPRLTAGSYRFYCLPHRAYRAEGELRIEDE